MILNARRYSVTSWRGVRSKEAPAIERISFQWNATAV